ncbi:NUDIX hydrolase [Photobacterium sp. 1_MG-2023]|uniref:NUDIX hydrolase n=1 Tax=Photobacterium sp. 1_MG-2023 TaxID=3062646 RepID=UPI0026E25E9E|nr:NUDIX hydrolase [Photobacterium sp. 1_MG-2023]MDO6709033.1 NUDIX hydrolase [Photobacterium sp. 1_MG-2023]
MNHLAMAVVIRDGFVLVQKRFRKNAGMVFEFPGGSMDVGESGEQAAIRELWEETGLTNLKTLCTYKSINENGGDIHYVVFGATMDAEPKEIDPCRQQTFYWFEVSQIPQSDFYSADVNFIKNYLGRYISQTPQD